MDIRELQEKAKLERQSGNHEEAAKLYKQAYEQTSDKWDGWGLALCYNKLKNYKEALAISKEVYDSAPDFEYVKSTLAQALYLGKIKKISPDFSVEDIKKNIDTVILLEEERRFWTGPALLEGMSHFADNNEWETVYNLSKLKDSSVFSVEPAKFKNGKKGPSDREKWYLKAAKACLKLEKWDECQEICKQGLNDFPNEVWLKRDHALAVGYGGDVVQAIDSLNSLLKFQKDWFIYNDIASMYTLDSKLDEAKNSLILGCLQSLRIPNPEYRWEMYYNLGSLLVQTGDIEHGKLHFQLAYALRNEAGWKIPDILEEIMSKHEVETQFEKSAKQFTKELSSYWENQRPDPYEGKPSFHGTVKTILGNGKSGFISGEEKDYYFNFNEFKGNRSLIEVRLPVTFYIEKSFDKSKGVESEIAVNIIEK